MKSLSKKIFVSVLVFAGVAQAEVTFKGDFRFRNENIKEEQVAPAPEGDRTRQRIRVRLAATGKVNEATDVVIRLASGSVLNTESTSTNQDLTDYYSKKTIVFDLAYFQWKVSDKMTILGGKTLNPFYSAGGNDLVFDGDLTPEGLSLKYLYAFDTSTEIFFNTGATWLSERYSATGATDNTDIGLVGAQLGTNYKAEGWSAGIVASVYNFSNIKGATAPAAKGNTLAGGLYTVDYKLTSVGLEGGTKVLDVPVTAFVESLTNSDGGNYKKGSIYGVKLGKLKDKDSWVFTVDQRELEKDATVGVLSDSDASGGGTDIRALRFMGGYQVADNANISLTYLTGEKTISSTTFSPKYHRAQFDFNFAF